MDIFAQFATDESAEVEGRWFPLNKTAKLLLARSGNTNFNAQLRAALAKNQIDLDAGGVDADNLAEGLIVDVMATTILLGWEGLEYKGRAVSYSPEMARTMLRIKDFRKKVSGFSESMEAYRAKAETAQGND